MIVMKKISLLLMLFMGLMACNNDDDMVFSESSTARVQKLQDDCDEMLRSKADGWKMVYVPNPTKHGGFNVLMKFGENGQVRIMTDYTEGESNTTYSMNASQGAVLSFDTYSCLHDLANPANEPLGEGMEGEFEFVIQEVTPDSIVFTGKKHGYKAVFYPATAEDWVDLIPAAKENLAKLEPASNTPFFRSLTMNSTAVNLVYEPSTRAASVTWADDATRTTETFLTAIYGTREGVGFSPALKINGVVVDELKYDESKETFVVNTPGVIGSLKYVDEPPIPFYNSFTDLSGTANGAGLPLIGKFQFSLNMLVEIMNIFGTMSDMSADLKTGYPLAVIGGLKQFKIAWHSPLADIEDGAWFSWFGTTQLLNDGEFYYLDGINYESLREEGDQVRFELNGRTHTTDTAFMERVQGWSVYDTFTDFFLDEKGFTVVPAGNDEYYFVSIADSKRWMILSKN